MASAPAPQYVSAPQPQRSAPEHYLDIPRPPGAVGTQEARVQPAPANSNGVGNFFDNIFGRR
jgi:hypothetical protein